MLSKRYAALAGELERFERGDVRYSDLPQLGMAPRILIFKPDDIGDAVYALPAVLRLKERFPRARLFLICQKKTAPVFEATGMFDVIAAVSVKARLIRFQSLDLRAALDSLGEREFDAAIFLRSYPAFFSTFKKIPARVKVHPRDPRLRSGSPYQSYISLWGRERAHQAVQMLQIIGRVTGESYTTADVRWPEFRWNESDRKAVEKVLGTDDTDYVVVHPFARFETRRYPYAYWKRLIAALQEKIATRWVVIGGGDDPSLSLPSVIQVQGKLSLGETGYLLSRCRAFLGNESGPGHWAAALGKPVVTLLSGHSHVSEWGVWGGNALNLRRDVPCQNCYLRACPKYRVRCLTELTPELVAPRVLAALRPHFC